MLTVDTPRLGSRERDRRNGFTIPPRRDDRGRWSRARAGRRWSRAFLREGRLRAGEPGGRPGREALAQFATRRSTRR